MRPDDTRVYICEVDRRAWPSMAAMPWIREDMKARGLASPDCGDVLAMTFAVNVLPKPKPMIDPRREMLWGVNPDEARMG